MKPVAGPRLSIRGVILFVLCALLLPADGFQLSASGSQLPAHGFRLTASGLQLPAHGIQLTASGSQPPAAQTPQQLPELEQLKPTAHAALPQNIDDYWFAPRAAERAARSGILAQAAEAYASGNYAASLTYARQAVAAGGPLLPYAQLYLGQSLLRLSNAADAGKTFDAILDRKPEGYLSVAATVGKAEALELSGRPAAAVELYERISTHKSISPDDILTRLGRAAQAAGDRKRAAEAWLRVYYEFPLTEAAKTAASALAALQDIITKNDYKRDLGRALILFGAKRYTDARGPGRACSRSS